MIFVTMFLSNLVEHFEHPEQIAEFFANFSLTAEDVSGFAFEISGNGRDPADVAREWVEANPDRVDAWLGL